MCDVYGISVFKTLEWRNKMAEEWNSVMLDGSVKRWNDPSAISTSSHSHLGHDFTTRFSDSAYACLPEEGYVFLGDVVHWSMRYTFASDMKLIKPKYSPWLEFIGGVKYIHIDPYLKRSAMKVW